MTASVVEGERESLKRRVLHTLLKGLAFVPNLVFAAVVGSILAAPISLLLFRVFSSHVAAYIQDVTTLLPSILSGIPGGSQVPSFGRTLDLDSGDCAVDVGRASQRSRLCRPELWPVAVTVLPARIRLLHPHGVRRRIDLAVIYTADALLHRLFAGSEVRGARRTLIWSDSTKAPDVYGAYLRNSHNFLAGLFIYTPSEVEVRDWG